MRGTPGHIHGALLEVPVKRSRDGHSGVNQGGCANQPIPRIRRGLGSWHLQVVEQGLDEKRLAKLNPMRAIFPATGSRKGTASVFNKAIARPNFLPGFDWARRSARAAWSTSAVMPLSSGNRSGTFRSLRKPLRNKELSHKKELSPRIRWSLQGCGPSNPSATISSCAATPVRS